MRFRVLAPLSSRDLPEGHTPLRVLDDAVELEVEISDGPEPRHFMIEAMRVVRQALGAASLPPGSYALLYRPEVDVEARTFAEADRALVESGDAERVAIASPAADTDALLDGFSRIMGGVARAFDRAIEDSDRATTLDEQLGALRHLGFSTSELDEMGAEVRRGAAALEGSLSEARNELDPDALKRLQRAFGGASEDDDEG